MIGPGNQKNEAYVIWFTGFSGAGKSTLGDRLFEHLKSGSHPVERLDGDIVRSIFPETVLTRIQGIVILKRIGYLASLYWEQSRFRWLPS